MYVLLYNTRFYYNLFLVNVLDIKVKNYKLNKTFVLPNRNLKFDTLQIYINKYESSEQGTDINLAILF